MSDKTFVAITFNTESGGRPHFHEYVKTLVAEKSPDVIAFQEVHNAQKPEAPTLFMPNDPGKRTHPIRLHLYDELKSLLGPTYTSYFAAHLQGVHDLEGCAYESLYGQALFVHTRCVVDFFRSDFVYGRRNQFNTEHEGGTPAGKAALSVSLQIPSGEKIVVTNLHGFWSRHGKIDMPERFTQNKGIDWHVGRVLSATAKDARLIVLGDLNYRSDLRALEDLRAKSLFGSEGGIVLNHQFDVVRTRTDHYSKWEQEPEADFVIACPRLAENAVYLKPDLQAPSDHASVIGRFAFN
ncbi:MAG: endonuclease/exonuclease/phosphatase family protein [Patescibacteria group bacterium]